MYRILSASKDGYITDKYVGGVRSTDANVGRAGTIDLFKLYNETFLSVTSSVSGVFERSRALIQFPIETLSALTASGKLNTSDPSFKSYLFLRTFMADKQLHLTSLYV